MKTSDGSKLVSTRSRGNAIYRQIHLSARRPRRAAGGPFTYDRPTDFFISACDLIDLLLFVREAIWRRHCQGCQHAREDI